MAVGNDSLLGGYGLHCLFCLMQVHLLDVASLCAFRRLPHARQRRYLSARGARLPGSLS